MNFAARLRLFVPVMVFLALAFFFWQGLSIDARALPSTLIGKKIPDFDVPLLQDEKQRFTAQDLHSKVSLIHFWASWCGTCVEEHPLINKIASLRKVPIYSFNYKDERADALKWLKKHGNPYEKVGFDYEGNVGINFGVYGTPEIFIVDKQGIIRFKYAGNINEDIWQHKMLPLIEKLQQQ